MWQARKRLNSIGSQPAFQAMFFPETFFFFPLRSLTQDICLNPFMQEIRSWDDVPKFKNRQEEADFWAQTTIQPRLMNTAMVKPEIRESTTITLRLDPRMLSRLKRLARSRFLNYQSMLKQWLSERLEQEISSGAGLGSDWDRDRDR